MFKKLRNSHQIPTEKIAKAGAGGIKIVLLLIVAAFLLSNSFYMLSEDKVAVVNTFGKPISVTKAGPHFKIPFIQEVYKMSKEISGMSIGYNEQDESTRSESEMITKDFNFVNIDFYIEYRIIDPVRAYIHKDTSVEILKNLAQSYIRDTVGVYNVDEVITTGKAEIQATVKSKLSERLELEDIGLGIENVTIQDSEPPTAEVNNAFKAVEDAKQSMDTMINEAKKYQSERIPEANASADKARKDADAFYQERISEAEGQVARFNQMYDEYIKYPLITKKRMFYETMEDVLPSLKVIIDGSDGTQMLLPLDQFSTNIQNGGVSNESDQ